jgi:protein-tyrosine-phosphatase
LAVAVWNRRSSLPATSAGTHPATEIHPGAVAAAKRRKLPMRPDTPRHFDDVVRPNDVIIAVCDNAHEELPADSRRLHWSIADPVRVGRVAAFDRALDELMVRIDHLASTLDPR